MVSAPKIMAQDGPSMAEAAVFECRSASVTLGSRQALRLIIEDNAGLFSDSARQEAKAKLARLQSPVNREVHIQTYKALPESQAKALAEAKGDKGKIQSVWESWATEHLRGERGLVVLINWDPGKVLVKADRAVAGAGYSNASGNDLRERLIKSLGDAKKNNNEAERKKLDRKSTRLDSSHIPLSRMPSSA